MVIGDRVVAVCGPNEAIGFMSVIDDAPRSSTARVKETCEVSVIDRRKFRFMIDEVPNFALYIMGAMARRIRGMGQAMSTKFRVIARTKPNSKVQDFKVRNFKVQDSKVQRLQSARLQKCKTPKCKKQLK